MGEGNSAIDALRKPEIIRIHNQLFHQLISLAWIAWLASESFGSRKITLAKYECYSLVKTNNEGAIWCESLLLTSPNLLVIIGHPCRFGDFSKANEARMRNGKRRICHRFEGVSEDRRSHRHPKQIAVQDRRPRLRRWVRCEHGYGVPRLFHQLGAVPDSTREPVTGRVWRYSQLNLGGIDCLCAGGRPENRGCGKGRRRFECGVGDVHDDVGAQLPCESYCIPTIDGFAESAGRDVPGKSRGYPDVLLRDRLRSRF